MYGHAINDLVLWRMTIGRLGCFHGNALAFLRRAPKAFLALSISLSFRFAFRCGFTLKSTLSQFRGCLPCDTS